MRHIKTLAFVIQDDVSYSLAVALLPPVFATLPFNEVIGYTVIINDLHTGYRKGNRAQTLEIGNSWVKPTDFPELYEADIALPAITLTETIRIK